jgi:mannose-6-phosphate isomerase-like protein (cupin superfamily)
LGIQFLPQSDLPHDEISQYLVGESFGGVDVCIIFVDAAPGDGPRLHTHPYVEVLIVLEGTATFDDGESKREVGAGEVAVVPAGQAHAFVNSGAGRLRQINIHLSPKFITDWLD